MIIKRYPKCDLCAHTMEENPEVCAFCTGDFFQLAPVVALYSGINVAGIAYTMPIIATTESEALEIAKSCNPDMHTSLTIYRFPYDN